MRGVPRQNTRPSPMAVIGKVENGAKYGQMYLLIINCSERVTIRVICRWKDIYVKNTHV